MAEVVGEEDGVLDSEVGSGDAVLVDVDLGEDGSGYVSLSGGIDDLVGVATAPEHPDGSVDSPFEELDFGAAGIADAFGVAFFSGDSALFFFESGEIDGIGVVGFKELVALVLETLEASSLDLDLASTDALLGEEIAGQVGEGLGGLLPVELHTVEEVVGYVVFDLVYV